MVEVCKCCGQTLPRRLDIGIKLAPGPQRIVELIHAAGLHGMESSRLFDKLYGHDANGGPETGMKVLHVRICQLNRRLKVVGLRIKGEHTGSNIPGFYKLISL